MGPNLINNLRGMSDGSFVCLKLKFIYFLEATLEPDTQHKSLLNFVVSEWAKKIGTITKKTAEPDMCRFPVQLTSYSTLCVTPSKKEDVGRMRHT